MQEARERLAAPLFVALALWIMCLKRCLMIYHMARFAVGVICNIHVIILTDNYYSIGFI